MPFQADACAVELISLSLSLRFWFFSSLLGFLTGKRTKVHLSTRKLSTGSFGNFYYKIVFL